MSYDFRNFLTKQSDENLTEEAVSVKTSIKTFNRNFYKAGEQFVCNLDELLLAMRFEAYKSNTGDSFFIYDENSDVKQWLDIYKQSFNLTLNTNLFQVKSEYYIPVEKAIEIVEYMISLDSKILSTLKDESKREYVEKVQRKRIQLMDKLQNDITTNLEKKRVVETKFENVVEGVVNSKGLSTKCVFFTKTDYKSCVDLRELLTHLGFDDVITEKPLAWLMMQKGKIELSNKENYYHNELLDTTYVDIDLAIKICNITYHTYEDERNRKRISHVVKFLKTQYSTKNINRILENEEHIESLKSEIKSQLLSLV